MRALEPEEELAGGGAARRERSRLHVEERGMTGGQAVTTRWRTLGVLGVMALVFSACSGGGATTAPSVAAPRRHRRSRPVRRRPRRRREAAAPVTIEWWHITTGDPGKTVFQGDRGRLHGGAPERQDQHHDPRERGVQDQARDQHAVGPGARPVPVVGRRHHGRAGRRRHAQGHHRDIASWKDTINPGALSIYAYKGVQYGVPWDMGMIGVWYNKALFAKAGIIGPARDVG